jgi:hypothetical protein
MNALMQMFNRRVTSDRLDGSLARWVSSIGGLGLFVFVAVNLLTRRAGGPTELVVGLALALGDGLLLVLCGTLIHRLELLVAEQPMPLRSRLPELASYAAALVMLTAGIWSLSLVSLERGELIGWILAVIGVSIAAICFGAGTTLRRLAAATP